MTPPKKRRRVPALTKSTTIRFRSGCGELIVTVGRDSKGIVHVFCKTEHGGCPSQSEGIARLVSVSLQYGMPVTAIVGALRGIACDRLESRKNKDNIECLSCPDGIAKVIEDKVNGG